MRPAIACLLLVGLGLAVAALRTPPTPRSGGAALAIAAPTPSDVAPARAVLAAAPKTSPPG